MRKGIKLILTATLTAVLMLGAGGCGCSKDSNATPNSSETVQQSNPIVLQTDTNGETVVLMYKRDASNDTEVKIENTDDVQIKGISEGAFAGNSTIKKVTMPDTVEHIDRLAFRSCTALEEIEFSNSLSVIGSGAFMSTSLKEVSLPASVTTIEAKAFANNIKLEKLTINEGVVRLENIAEGSAKLTELYLPSTITEIADDFTVSKNTVVYTPDNSIVIDYCTAKGINYEII